MRKTILALILLAGMWAVLPSPASAQKKTNAHIVYVMKNMKLTGDVKTKFTAMLEKYYEEVNKAKAENKALKDKYKAADTSGKLKPEECDQLFNSKYEAEIAELNIRKKYYAQFKTIMTPQQAYKAIRLCNDKVE